MPFPTKVITETWSTRQSVVLRPRSGCQPCELTGSGSGWRSSLQRLSLSVIGRFRVPRPTPPECVGEEGTPAGTRGLSAGRAEEEASRRERPAPAGAPLVPGPAPGAHPGAEGTTSASQLVHEPPDTVLPAGSDGPLRPCSPPTSRSEGRTSSP